MKQTEQNILNFKQFNGFRWWNIVSLLVKLELYLCIYKLKHLSVSHIYLFIIQCWKYKYSPIFFVFYYSDFLMIHPLIVLCWLINFQKNIIILKNRIQDHFVAPWLSLSWCFGIYDVLQCDQSVSGFRTHKEVRKVILKTGMISLN